MIRVWILKYSLEDYVFYSVSYSNFYDSGSFLVFSANATITKTIHYYEWFEWLESFINYCEYFSKGGSNIFRMVGVWYQLCMHTHCILYL